MVIYYILDNSKQQYHIMSNPGEKENTITIRVFWASDIPPNSTPPHFTGPLKKGVIQLLASVLVVPDCLEVIKLYANFSWTE